MWGDHEERDKCGKDAMEGKAPNKNKDFPLILRGHTYKR